MWKVEAVGIKHTFIIFANWVEVEDRGIMSLPRLLLCNNETKGCVELGPLNS